MKANITKCSLFSFFFLSFFSASTQELLHQTSWDEGTAGTLRLIDIESQEILDSFIFDGIVPTFDGQSYNMHDISRHPDGAVYGVHDSSLVRLKLEDNGFEPVEMIPYDSMVIDSQMYQLFFLDSLWDFFRCPYGLCSDHVGRFYFGGYGGVDTNYVGYVFRYDPTLDTTELLMRFPDHQINDIEFWDGKLIIPSSWKGESVWYWDLYTQKLDTLPAWNHEWSIFNLSNDASPCETNRLFVSKGNFVYTYHMATGEVETWIPPDLRWSSGGSTSTQSYYGSLPNMRIDSMRIVDGVCASYMDVRIFIPEPRRQDALYSANGETPTMDDTVRLQFGVNTLEVLDSFACMALDTIYLPSSPLDLVQIDIDSPSCPMDTGSMNISSVDHLVELSLDGVAWSTSISLEQVASSLYSLYARYTEDCVDSMLIDLRLTDYPKIEIEWIAEEVSCDSVMALVSVDIRGDLSPYIVVLGLDTLDSYDSLYLFPGSYPISVLDANGCSADSVLNVLSGENTLIQEVELHYPECDKEDGRLVVLASTDSLIYSLSGQTPNTTGVFDGLAAGEYALIVASPDGCVDSFPIQLRGMYRFYDTTFVCDEMTIDSAVNVRVGEWCDSTFVLVFFPLSQSVDLIGNFVGMVGDTVEFRLESLADFGGDLEILWDSRLEIFEFIEGGGRMILPETGTYSWSYAIGDSCEIENHFSVITSTGTDLYVPNVFSPNGDEVNDSWQVYASSESLIEDLEIEIYNRKGHKVYHYQGGLPHEKPWRGTVNEEELPSGVYVYVIQYRLPSGVAQISGDITLVR